MLALKDGGSRCKGAVPAEGQLSCWCEPPERFTETSETACQAVDAQNDLVS